MKDLKKHSAFTLVELIVVIVILAILATIAFLSFSSQSGSARDSARLADMNNISKGLGVLNAAVGKLPMPDKKINITASGTIIRYQGYVGSNVLNMIKLSNGGKDPLDAATYYTYSTNSSQSKFQILGFLEDGSNSALSLLPPLLSGEGWGEGRANAEPNTYSGRYVVTMGDLLGIVLESSTKVPAQAAMNDIDVSKTNTGYIEQFTNKDYIIGTGSSLLSNILIRRNDLSDDTTLLKYDDSILGYWNMETTTGAYLKDLSRYENLGTLNGVIAGGVNGIKGKATNFTGTGGYIKASDNSNWNIGSKNMTINLWIKQSSYSAGGNRLVSSWDGGSSNYGTSQFVFYVSSTGEIVGNFGNGTGWQATTLITSPNIILLNNWYNIQIIFDTTQIKVYVNNELKKSSTRPALQNSTKLQIGGWDWDLPYSGINRYFQGSIDEVRIYNRALGESETQALYESLK